MESSKSDVRVAQKLNSLRDAVKNALQDALKQELNNIDEDDKGEGRNNAAHKALIELLKKPDCIKLLKKDWVISDEEQEPKKLLPKVLNNDFFQVIEDLDLDAVQIISNNEFAAALSSALISAGFQEKQKGILLAVVNDLLEVKDKHITEMQNKQKRSDAPSANQVLYYGVVSRWQAQSQDKKIPQTPLNTIDLFEDDKAPVEAVSDLTLEEQNKAPVVADGSDSGDVPNEQKGANQTLVETENAGELMPEGPNDSSIVKADSDTEVQPETANGLTPDGQNEEPVVVSDGGNAPSEQKDDKRRLESSSFTGFDFSSILSWKGGCTILFVGAMVACAADYCFNTGVINALMNLVKEYAEPTLHYVGIV